MIKFGYRRSMADPEGLTLVQTKAKRYDRRRMWRTDRGDILRPQDFADGHLVNTVRYLRRLALEKGRAMAKMLDDMSEASQDALGTEADDWTDPEKIYPILPVLCREIERRGLVEKDPFETKEIKRPFSKVLFGDSEQPVVLCSDNDAGEEHVALWLETESGAFTKPEIVELRDTLTKILSGWR